MAHVFRKPGAWFSMGVAAVLVGVLLVKLDGHRSPEWPASSAPPVSVPAPPAEAASWMHKLGPGEKPPQFVLFSFDGAGSHDHWQRVLPLAKSVHAHFSGFLSGIYLLPNAQRGQYTGPGHPTGKASIGFGGSEDEVRTLVSDLNTAVDQGEEIGTHYNGHFCTGAEPSVGHWSTAAWDRELRQFFGFVDGARTGRGLRVDPAAIKGGRTPCLEGDWAQAFPAMRDSGLQYDSSRPSDGVKWPSQVDGLWEFWMPYVKVPALGKKVIMMDYNLWFQYNHAQEDSSHTAEYTQDTVETYRGAYQAAFQGNRAPLVVGNHFNDWAGGAFAKATEDFMGEVCGKPETVCATYSEVIRWMSLQDPAVLDRYRQMPAAQP
ncbi:polysaccharide deacetylase [Amycolatopsis sp. PS_44_ISF1]|uniref:polysaccharide deacetylase n=1 Tax=Amycolatopsis sp. PS_44_ISF1 TaxID=2974917 RepID=UPI0028DD9949|nr:polysaccharide deacetylase [Amycolatopsis sp. PS_44_ISF1]MDT8915156.1 polysaccharide deacetylase [Amycolatopsis sp. PS_44_ISF1]